MLCFKVLKVKLNFLQDEFSDKYVELKWNGYISEWTGAGNLVKKKVGMI